MHFSQVLVATTALFSFTSASTISARRADLAAQELSARTAAEIKAALVDIGDEATILSDLFAAATGADGEVDAIRAQNQVLLDTVAAGETIATNSAALTVVEALGLASTIAGLQTILDEAFSVLVDKKPLIDSLGFTAEVHDQLVIQQAAVNSFGVVLISKVPTSVKPIAQGYIDDFNEAYDEIIATYSS